MRVVPCPDCRVLMRRLEDERDRSRHWVELQTVPGGSVVVDVRHGTFRRALPGHGQHAIHDEARCRARRSA